jgi:hypothetical protein
MGRVFQEIEVEGQKFWTLFDIGSVNTYVISSVGQLLLGKTLSETRIAHFGGGTHQIKQYALLEGEVEEYKIDTEAYVVNEIGEDENDREIEILFGALAMQKWGIIINMKEEKLDFSHYPKEFVEF